MFAGFGLDSGSFGLDIRSRDSHDGREGIVFIEAHDTDPLRVASDDADIARGDALDFSTRGHHDQFVVVIDSHGADDRSVALGGLDVDDAFATPSLGPVAWRRGVFVVGRIIAGCL